MIPDGGINISQLMTEAVFFFVEEQMNSFGRLGHRFHFSLLHALMLQHIALRCQLLKAQS